MKRRDPKRNRRYFNALGMSQRGSLGEPRNIELVARRAYALGPLVCGWPVNPEARPGPSERGCGGTRKARVRRRLKAEAGRRLRESERLANLAEFRERQRLQEQADRAARYDWLAHQRWLREEQAR